MKKILSWDNWENGIIQEKLYIYIQFLCLIYFDNKRKNIFFIEIKQM